MFRWLLLLLSLLLLFSAPLLAQEKRGPEALDYASRWGSVTFQHFKHQQRVGNCQVCHHLGVQMGACGNCHGVIPGLPQRKDVLHKKCIGCHWKQHGPTDCIGCHNPAQLNDAVYKD